MRNTLLFCILCAALPVTASAYSKGGAQPSAPSPIGSCQTNPAGCPAFRDVLVTIRGTLNEMSKPGGVMLTAGRPVPDQDYGGVTALIDAVLTACCCLAPPVHAAGAKFTDEELVHADGKKDKQATSSEEAREFTFAILNTLFDKYVNHRGTESDPTGLSSRIVKTYQQIVSGEISIAFDSKSMPRNKAVLFTSGYDPERHRPRITAHTPGLNSRQRTESAVSFTDILAVSIAHEKIHFEVCQHRLGYKHAKKEVQTEEAMAWGVTIIEILRPMAAQRRVPYPEMLAASVPLKDQFADDYSHPRWVEGFGGHIIDLPADNNGKR